MDRKRTDSLSPITLAYVGDAVFTLYVRTRLTEKYDYKTDRLGKLCSAYVCASTQSKILEAACNDLTDAEADIIRRCRNAHTPAKAKNATLGDYKRATSLEGVLGYLYLTEQNDRLKELLSLFFDLATEINGLNDPLKG